MYESIEREIQVSYTEVSLNWFHNDVGDTLEHVIFDIYDVIHIEDISIYFFFIK